MPGLRDLPSVDQVLRRLGALDGFPQRLIAKEVRCLLAERRRLLQDGAVAEMPPVEEEVRERLAALVQPRLRLVINATGVVLHTNLGRAPLPEFEPHPGYTNLEYDLVAGERGKRDALVAPLLEHLLGRPGIVVNNNAAAIYLVLNELAAGREVIVSRGELIEIGDGFRIPEIMARSGAVLHEVGTTNRTRIEDYERAIGEQTGLILRVHRSNFRISGFTARPPLDALTSLARSRGIPLYEDLGSGCLVDLRGAGIDEPLVSQSLDAGANLVSFSCDKLLGGPQAGVIAGQASLVARIRRNPMYRAFRVDKLILQALETTLRHVVREEWDRIPALRMILAPLNELRGRAERIIAHLASPVCRIRETASLIGGGATPDQKLPSYVIEVNVPDAARFERLLRNSAMPVIVRVEHGKVLLDLRTVFERQEPALISGLKEALAAVEA